MSQLSSYLRGGRNPSTEARPFIEKIPGTVKPYYDPYINAGNEAGETLGNEYKRELSPDEFFEDFMSKYKPSGAYEAKKKELSRTLSNVAASGGYAGTDFDQRNQAKMIDELLSGDMQEFFNNLYGIYNHGIEGERDIYNKGYGASTGFADVLGNNLTAQGGLKFQEASQKNASQQALVNSLLKFLSQSGFGGGFDKMGSMVSSGGGFV